MSSSVPRIFGDGCLAMTVVKQPVTAMHDRLHTAPKACYSGDNDDDGGYSQRRRRKSMPIKGKKVIALGERDGIQGTAIAECARSAGAEVVLEMTHCFV
jgi:glycine reductase